MIKASIRKRVIYVLFICLIIWGLHWQNFAIQRVATQLQLSKLQQQQKLQPPKEYVVLPPPVTKSATIERSSQPNKERVDDSISIIDEATKEFPAASESSIPAAQNNHPNEEGDNDTDNTSIHAVTPDVSAQDDDKHVQETIEEVIILPQKTTELIKEYIDTKLDATDRIKNVVASRLEVTEPSPEIIEEMKKVSISIVMSHCENPVNWIPEYIGKDYSIKDITIYSKCGNEVEGIELLKELSSTVNVIVLPNVGRNDHTYAYYIKEQYKLVVENEETNGNDIVMFLKDRKGTKPSHSLDVLFSDASRSGFACVTKPLMHVKYRGDDSPFLATNQHLREYLFDNFAMGGYTRMERDTDDAFFSDKYTSLRNWQEEMKFVVPASETMPVCYKGLFVAQKRQFLNQPEKAWENMVESLSRADNLMEGHYAERMWASILSDVDEESAKAVDEVLSPHIGLISKVGEFNPLKGQVYINRNVEINQNEEP